MIHRSKHNLKTMDSLNYIAFHFGCRFKSVFPKRMLMLMFKSLQQRIKRKTRTLVLTWLQTSVGSVVNSRCSSAPGVPLCPRSDIIGCRQLGVLYLFVSDFIVVINQFNSDVSVDSIVAIYRTRVMFFWKKKKKKKKGRPYWSQTGV